MRIDSGSIEKVARQASEEDSAPDNAQPSGPEAAAQENAPVPEIHPNILQMLISLIRGGDGGGSDGPPPTLPVANGSDEASALRSGSGSGSDGPPPTLPGY